VSFLTEAEVRAFVQRRGPQLAEAELRKAAATDLSITLREVGGSHVRDEHRNSVPP
jgi:hypothetical protein